MRNYILSYPEALYIHIPRTGGDTILNILWEESYTDTLLGEWRSEWDKLFSFAFIRHPLDRLVSAYMASSLSSLDTFAVENIYSRNVMTSLMPITNSINFIDKANFVGRYERFQADLESIIKHLKIETSYPIKCVTSARTITWQQCIEEQMSSDIYDAVIDYYRSDFKEFRYGIPTMGNLRLR